MRRLLDINIGENFDIHNANLLPAELKLLHSMIYRIFFPRIRRFDWISSKVLGVMVHLVEETAMNLFFMMIEQIKTAAGKSNSQVCLSYGTVFTLIFREAGIDLDGKDFRSLKHTDHYTIHSLHRMKFRKEGDV